jgi:hypothetical protein
MTNLDHLYGPSGVIHRVNHAVVALPDPEPTFRTRKLFTITRPRFSCKPRNSSNDASRSRFDRIASISLAADGLIRSLYPATPPQILNEGLEGHAVLPCAFFEGRQVLSIFRQGELHCFVNHL